MQGEFLGLHTSPDLGSIPPLAGDVCSCVKEIAPRAERQPIWGTGSGTGGCHPCGVVPGGDHTPSPPVEMGRDGTRMWSRAFLLFSSFPRKLVAKIKVYNNLPVCRAFEVSWRLGKGLRAPGSEMRCRQVAGSQGDLGRHGNLCGSECGRGQPGRRGW